MKPSKRKILWLLSAIVSYALYVVIGLGINGKLSFYLLGVIVLMTIYSVVVQFRKAKEARELKKVRDELLEQRWHEEMESRSKT